jgi:DNA-binding NarL/FixJ family response regulator
MTKIRVLLADDHKVLLDGLQNLLSGIPDIECAGRASNGKAVLDFLEEHEVDVILMDINMPVMDGVEATKKVHEKYPDVKIIALTMLEQGSFIQQMLKNGAVGFLLKNSGKDQVLNAIRTVSLGGQYLGPEATQLLIENMQGEDEKKRAFIPKVTRRELEVLELVSNGLPTQEIADTLFISFNTVESHRKNLLSKFGARNVAELVRMAVERGIL